jgi:hypothetical protein
MAPIVVFEISKFCKNKLVMNSVADPDPGADPDPIYTDPDPAFHFDTETDPEPTFQFDTVRIRIRLMQNQILTVSKR